MDEKATLVNVKNPLARAVLGAACLPMACLGHEHPDLIWDGAAVEGTEAFVFGNTYECHSPSTLHVGREHGDDGRKAWIFSKKADSERCEVRNVRVPPGGSTFKPVAGETYYLAWSSKFEHISDPGTELVMFQWKSYSDPSNTASPHQAQNYPFIMQVKYDAARLFYVGPRGAEAPSEQWHLIWASPPGMDSRWHDFTMAIHVSANAADGWGRLWFDGEEQLLGEAGEVPVLQYAGRTLDSSNEPKWGVYKRGSFEADHLLYHPRIGLTLESVQLPSFAQ
jgi:hypothetical protein